MRQVLIPLAIAMSLLLTGAGSLSGIPDSQIVSESPTLVLLDQYGFFEAFALEDVVVRFGTLILEDHYGNKVNAARHTSLYLMIREICRQWLTGGGKQPVSWKTLISVLRQIQLKTLAANIEEQITGGTINNPFVTYPQNAVRFLKELYSRQKVIQFDSLRITHHTSFLAVLMKGDNDSKIHVPHWQGGIFNETSVPPHAKRLLISGQPGSGKTTLLQYLAKEWTEGKALHFCQILFLIRLGQLRSRGLKAWNSLTDMLTSAFLDIRDIQSVALEIASNNGAGACFLLDAYNEWYPYDYVHDLVFHNVLNNSFCILTSRFLKENSGLQFKHIKMIGFPHKDLDQYVAILANDNQSLTQSVLDLWSKYPDVRDMCTLPLHLSMVMFIMRYETKPRIHTRAQIYMAFVNTTIKYYQHTHHLHWNTISLRRCLLSLSINDDLCTAFQTLHLVAFKMLLNRVYTFPDNPDIRRNIERLGFVDINLKPSTSDLVQYTFSHFTFLEFFAILHLITLSRNEQLVYIDLFGREQNNMIPLFVELNSLLHQSGNKEGVTHTVKQVFYPTCTLTNVTALNYSMEVVTQVYDNKQIDGFVNIAQSCIYDIWNHRFLGGVLNQTAVHRSLKGETNCMNYSVVLEDWNQTPLQYYDLLHFCLSGQLHICVEITKLKVKILRIEHLANQMCINRLFKTVRRYLTHLSLIQVSTNIENMFILNNEIHSLIGIPVEIIMVVQHAYCEWTNIIEHLELFSTIKGMHIISDCKFVGEVIAYRPWIVPSNVIHLPQYETLNITSGNLPFLMELLHRQTQLKHLRLHEVYFNMTTVTNKGQFFRYITTNRFLQTLEIVRSAFGDTEVKELLNCLPSTLYALNLDGNNLTDEIIPVLALSIRQNFHEFKYLSLKHNKITEKGVKLLISALKSKTSIHYLDLSSNPILIDEQNFMELLWLKNLEYLGVDGCHVLNNEGLLLNLSHSLPKLQCLHLCNDQLRAKKVDESMMDENEVHKTKMYTHPVYESCCSISSPSMVPTTSGFTSNINVISSNRSSKRVQDLTMWLEMDLYNILMFNILFGILNYVQ